jgi:hypothetical protein
MENENLNEAENPALNKGDVSGSYTWIPVTERLPKTENYYAVRFKNGDEDEKPFRIRPKKNIFGFMTMDEVTHWAEL